MGKQKNKGFNAPFAGLAKRVDRPAAAPPPPAAPPPAMAPPDAPEPPADALLFERAMRGTQPLGQKRERLPPPVVEKSLPSDEQLALAELQSLVQGEGSFRVHESEEIYTGLAPGVSFQLLHQLQRGNFAFHRHLDLHGYSREEAHTELARFVASARRADERCVLVVTGRGKSSPGGISVLRDALPRWLSRAPLRAHVLAFCTARAVDGGPGAFYLLLRRPGIKPYGVEMP